MDFFRRINSRHVLAAATVGLFAAGFGGACAAQDAGGAVAQAGYHGPYLEWSGKKPPAPEAAPATPAQDDAADLTEARYAPAPDYDPGRFASPPPRSAPPADASESRYGERAEDAAPTPPPAPPPAAAYAAPATYAPPRAAAEAAPQPPPAPTAAVQPPAPTAAVQPPAPVAPPAPHYAPAPSAPPVAERSEGTTGGHFYSVDRDYGLTPDPIPAPTEGHTVLIAPDPSQAADDHGQADQDEGDDAKPAKHGDKSDDGHSGDN